MIELTQGSRYGGAIVGAGVSALVAVVADRAGIDVVSWIAGLGIPVAGLVGFAMGPRVVSSPGIGVPTIMSYVSAILLAGVEVPIYLLTQARNTTLEANPLALPTDLVLLYALVTVVAFVVGTPIVLPIAFVSVLVLRALARLDRSLMRIPRRRDANRSASGDRGMTFGRRMCFCRPRVRRGT